MDVRPMTLEFDRPATAMVTAANRISGQRLQLSTTASSITGVALERGRRDITRVQRKPWTDSGWRSSFHSGRCRQCALCRQGNSATFRRMARPVAREAKTWSLVSHQTESTGPRSYVLAVGRGSCRAIELPAVGELLIGRDDEADIVLDDPASSRRHARLIVAGEEIRIADLGSHNGTRVNGVRVDGSVALAYGDEIAVGEVMIIVHASRRRRARVASNAEVGSNRISLGDREVIVADPAMVRIYELLARLARGDLPVLVCGETGVGKEHAAFAVHHGSPRRTGPFVVVNCAAIQESLVESELFGHEKGAFSGATSTKPGLLQTADGGTAFLDEVGELAPGIQAKLLRVVESHRITRVGSVREQAVDFRLVTATNRDLPAEVQAGRFRRDLLYRLNGATVEIPPLRDRPREIEILAREFLDEACRRAERLPLSLSASALQRLEAHGWPGNVRELRNAMQLAAATVVGDVVEAADLRLVNAVLGQGAGATGVATTSDAAVRAPSSAGRPVRPIAEELEQLEALRMAEALAACGGVQIRAAELIGMPMRTFSSKVKQYGLTTRLPKKTS
jgi:DNA-binding NtrC family response regulator